MTYLIGMGGHGRDILAIWNAVRPDDSIFLRDEKNYLYPPPRDNEAGPCYLGVNDPQVRYEMAQRLHQYWPAEALVHPSSTPGPDCFLNPGSVVARSVLLDHDVFLGTHTHVNYGTSMTRTTIGDFCTIAPGVVFGGDVIVGDRVFIGAGAIISNLVSIGDDAIVGAGAVVLHDVDHHQRVFGIPAQNQNGEI